ncbi:hypothetical protein GUITHDRAFT_158516 [Guillardia theta CCMP2712]|uniref:RNA helicase n=1 Tax=Guillardia theta (strain CCMP2712) TaxID=905079 RepID=L1IQZ7_GUITC|nr:hypothetical protein GUITHDRAFT_158516 [Guillardia theta CCMP2712]EKX38245.1 hypothetical protein GUITHDRAFT_158516 [Guillardia theta CCMP2712]|eukprot:XP_005825225.1 hypothetical protein GUITHDRAFT_158516 [Guillardia theta CCMP2712]
MNLEEVPLSKKVKAKLKECGITSLFPVQVKTFQTLMDGKDVVVRSRTGSGKTIAFALPVIEKILANKTRKHGRLPSCLVIAPTRELAIQIDREFTRIQPEVASTCVYGGVSIGMQVSALRKGVDVVVGTPGRLIDHLVNGTLDVSAVETFILDEADEMLKMGFQDDVERIIEYLPPSKQTNLWSATMPTWVKDLAQKYCKDVVFFDMVGNDSTRTSITIEHIAIACGYDSHANAISRVVKKYGKGGRVLVFCRTKLEVDRLANHPSLKTTARVIHGDVSQLQRERTLQDFRSGKFLILVATDVAARGIDVPEVELVIQTCVPEDSNTFVHRSGRTGRAGRKGVSVVFYSGGEERDLLEIEEELGIQFHLPVGTMPSSSPAHCTLRAAQRVFPSRMRS